MMKKELNNKGFAITGILYTLFILFLLIMMSVLAGLNSKKNSLEKSIMSLEESFSGNKTKSSDYVDYVNENKIAPVTGKYVFEFKVKDDPSTYTCSTYLYKDDSIEKNNVTFIPKDCNDYDYDFSFDSEDPYIFKIILKEVYSFEEE